MEYRGSNSGRNPVWSPVQYTLPWRGNNLYHRKGKWRGSIRSQSVFFRTICWLWKEQKKYPEVTGNNGRNKSLTHSGRTSPKGQRFRRRVQPPAHRRRKSLHRGRKEEELFPVFLHSPQRIYSNSHPDRHQYSCIHCNDCFRSGYYVSFHSVTTEMGSWLRTADSDRWLVAHSDLQLHTYRSFPSPDEHVCFHVCRTSVGRTDRRTPYVRFIPANRIMFGCIQPVYARWDNQRRSFRIYLRTLRYIPCIPPLSSHRQRTTKGIVNQHPHFCGV